MNWDAVGAIAEIVGALAVVGTLAYLATQIRQSNLSARIAARQEMTRQYSDFADSLINNPETNRLWRAGISDEELNEEEKELFGTLMRKCFWYFSAMFYQYELQSLSANEWHQSKMLIQGVSHNPGVEKWWSEAKTDFEPGFVKYIDMQIWGDV